MEKGKVYYDGNCPICNREINFYKKNICKSLFNWIDINNCSASDFEQNLDFSKTHDRFHLINLDNKVLSGVDAFIYLWRYIPSLKFLSLIARLPIIYHFLNILYKIFLYYRRKKSKFLFNSDL